MEEIKKFELTDAEKRKYINALTPEVIALRKRAGISQGELASFIGVSRQSYGDIERKTRTMSWNSYLALILFFDYNAKTHDMLHSIGAFPGGLLKQFNDGEEPRPFDVNAFFKDQSMPILEKLDDQALHTIKTLIMIEYARCTGNSGDSVVKAFDGITFRNVPGGSVDAAKAVKSIREKNKKK